MSNIASSHNITLQKHSNRSIQIITIITPFTLATSRLLLWQSIAVKEIKYLKGAGEDITATFMVNAFSYRDHFN